MIEKVGTTVAASLAIAFLLSSPKYAAAYVVYAIVQHCLRNSTAAEPPQAETKQHGSQPPRARVLMSPTVKYSGPGT